MPDLTREAIWLKEPLALEHAVLDIGEKSSRLRTRVIASEPIAYSLSATIECGPGYETTSLNVAVTGARLDRRLLLMRGADGRWDVHTVRADAEEEIGGPGGDPALLRDIDDVDLAYSPLTNTPPVLRHGLLRNGGQVVIRVAWVSVPDLSLTVAEQRYTPLHATERGRLIRFESLDGSFAADIEFDLDGLVLDYPGIARRLG